MQSGWTKMFARNGWRPSHLVWAVILVTAAVMVTLDAWQDLVATALKGTEPA